SWVDGSDFAHIETITHWLKETQQSIHNTAYSMCYIEHCELKLSLRSVEAFLPWINRIYIGTNGQIPTWLDTSHPKIQMVFHKDIFPQADNLPCFNSHAIAFQLHRIPGLSE